MATSVAGSLMVCGDSSDAGKTTIVAGLCRLLHRQGITVAPFKAQNMALNSAVTASGAEIGRAQYLQAQAARVPAEAAMNPILLKPTGERDSQVIVMGRAIGTMAAADYHRHKPELLAQVLAALEDLRGRFDVVLLEGAGSAAEINLLANDLVNLPLAHAAGVPAVVVGDIDRGGVFASLFGTATILPEHLRATIAGFIINKLRGDPALLLDGPDELRERTGIPTLGVIPMLRDLRLDAEDSVALTRPPPPAADATLDVAVVAFPLLSNFTDFEPLVLEDDVSLRYVGSARELGQPDLVILPGSKATVQDLGWLRSRGLDAAIAALPATTTVLGICAGYQMLGHSIDDAVESRVPSTVAGLGHLPVTTVFEADKHLAVRSGRATLSGQSVSVDGYQIHHGRVHAATGAEIWMSLDGNAGSHSGVRQGAVLGTTLHGLFDNDAFRRCFLTEVAERAGRSFSPTEDTVVARRDRELDRLADHLETHLDVAQLFAIIADG